MINVAIDGPAGAGKSTIAKAAAKTLGFIYVDTGALYRTIALSAVRCGADDNEEIINMLNDITVKLGFADDGSQCVYLNGENVSSLIRTPEISMAASKVSAIPEVRAFLLDLQRDIARENNVIMDGRDIASVVLPNAQPKIFLFASPEGKIKPGSHVTVSYGKLIKNSELGLDKENVGPHDIKDAANMVMGRITELWEAECKS